MPDLDPVIATWYDQACKAAYANAALLRSTVRVETGIVGGTAEFPRVSRGMAKPHVPVTPRVPVGATYAKAVCTLTAWDATEYVDNLDSTRIRFDQQPVLARVLGQAYGRREDQNIIDPVVAAFGAPTIADGGTGMTEAKLRQVVRIFDSRAVPRENRWLIVSAKVYDDMRSLSVAQNKDFGETSAARSGVIPTLFGLKVVMIDDARPEGGLPLSGNVRQCFAWDSDAVGLAIAREEPLRVEWVPHLAAWQLSMRGRMAGVVIDPEGVIRVDCTE